MSSIARLLLRLLTLVVLVASGSYVLIYLYRWEWNRALISGLFFLTALISLTTAMILAGLQKLSGRIDRLEARSRSSDQTAGTIRAANAAHAARHFRWLRESPDRLGVFVPLLIGAGALLSAVAYTIERVAGAVAGRSVDRTTAALLAPDLPFGADRTGTERAPTLEALDASTPRRRGGRGRQVIVTGAAAFLVLGGVLVLRDATQSRAEPGADRGETYIRLSIAQRGNAQPAEEIAEALWIACHGRLPSTTSVGEMYELDVETVDMVVDQGMGPLRRRRFFGCLEDATLEHVSARVERFEVRPRSVG